MTTLSTHSSNNVAGAAMDQPHPRRRSRRFVIAAAIAAVLLAGVFVLRLLEPRGLQVALSNIRIAAVEHGMYRDDIAVRASVVPLQSVILDAVDTGRVEEVFVHDGALVKQGDVLFRLSNPQRHLDLLARESERAQQISNLSSLRVALQNGSFERERRAADLGFAVAQAEKLHVRNIALAQKGFISASALDDSADRLGLQKQLQKMGKADDDEQLEIKHNALAQMESAIARMDAGLQLAHAAIDALAVRAPASGRLTDFRLQVGETVKADEHVGRIDDPAQFKLSAQVDEFHLNQLATGRAGTAIVDGSSFPLSLARIYPQVKDGYFSVELAFGGTQPPRLSPGQTVEAHVTLSEPGAALLLPNDAFVNDGGGSWVFVVSRDGGSAERRTVRLGRRNNGQVEVLAGLAAGEQVIVSGYSAYGQAQKLQIAR